MAVPLIRVRLVGENSHTAYIALPGYPEVIVPGIVSRTLNMNDLVKDYSGPRIHLDFNSEGILIGIEVLVFNQNAADTDDLAEE